MNLGFSAKIFLVGPTSLYFTLKTVEYHWKVEKQEKNYNKIIVMFNKMASQAVDIYNSAKKSKKSLEESIDSLKSVLDQIQDGRQSFLARIAKIVRIGALTPKKTIPDEVKESIQNDDSIEQVQTLQAKNKDE